MERREQHNPRTRKQVRTGEFVEEDFNTIPFETPLTSTPIETPWMSIRSLDASSAHRFVECTPPGGDVNHGDKTCLRVSGFGAVRVELKEDVCALIFSAWIESNTQTILRCRYFDADNNEIQPGGLTLTRDGQYVVSYLAQTNFAFDEIPKIRGVDIYLDSAVAGDEAFVDNFYSLVLPRENAGRTPGYVQESLNAISPGTPVTQDSVGSTWMQIYATSASENEHRFETCPPPRGDVDPPIHGDGTCLHMKGAGTVRCDLDEDAHVLIFSAWGIGPKSLLVAAILDEEGYPLANFGFPLPDSQKASFFNGYILVPPVIRTLELSFTDDDEDGVIDGECYIDNFFTLIPGVFSHRAAYPGADTQTHESLIRSPKEWNP
jgi:hypothetical protein